jgi:predicted nucleic acid-binding Zn ribbon protein
MPREVPERGDENRGPENLADVLARLFTARGWGRKSERVRLEQAWQDTVGAELARETRPGRLRRGVLEIEVRNGVLMQELAQFRKRKLLAALRERLPGMTLADLRFRVGVW